VTQIQQVFANINKDIFDVAWIKVKAEVSTSKCQWPLATSSATAAANNCAFIKAAIQETILLNGGGAVGVYSTRNIWIEYMGNHAACDIYTFNPTPYLWYASYINIDTVNNTQSYDDFLTFAGFPAPTMKDIDQSESINLCGNPSDTTSVD